MLFDLRSPHRRRVIKVVYTFLALLIGVGLVGFGVGTGGNFGGLFTSNTGGGGSASGQSAYIKALSKAEKKAKASPTNPGDWAAVGTAAYALATLPTNYVSNKGYTASGHAVLAKLQQAWTKYLTLAPAAPNIAFAQEVVYAFGPPPTGIGDYQLAEAAQELVAASQPTYNQYEYLAYYAYRANQLTNGDLAAAKAVALAPKKQQKQVKAALAQIRTQTVGTGATGATSTTSTTSSTG